MAFLLLLLFDAGASSQDIVLNVFLHVRPEEPIPNKACGVVKTLITCCSAWTALLFSYFRLFCLSDSLEQAMLSLSDNTSSGTVGLDRHGWRSLWTQSFCNPVKTVCKNIFLTKAGSYFKLEFSVKDQGLVLGSFEAFL